MREHLSDILIVAGAGAITGGVALLSIPLALAIGGSFIMWLGLLIAASSTTEVPK